MADENLDIRVDLVGQRQLHRDLMMTAADIQAVERATDRAGGAMARSTRRSFLWNQAMFTARRLVYDFTLGLGAAAAAIGVLGFNYNRTMETNTVALKFLLGSEEAATKELQILYDLAAKTPFAFAELTDVARRFLAWGFDVQFTNRALTATADAMAAMGGDPEIIRRIVRAFGQIRSRGKVMGEELNQLAEAGIPAYQFLREELGLTGEQLARVGALGIPAETAIEAIIRGMERTPDMGGFRGAAAELEGTTTGMLTTIWDYSQQLFGQIMLAPFNAIRNQLPAVRDTVTEMTAAMQAEGFMGMVRALDEGADAGGRIAGVMQYLIGVGQDFATIFSRGVWPALWANAKILGALLLPALWALAQVLNVVAMFSDELAPIIAILTFWWLAEKAAVLVNTIWTSRNTVAKKANRIWTMLLRREEQILSLWRWANNRAMQAQIATSSPYILAQWRMAIATGAVATATWFANTALGAFLITMTMFLLTNPVGWAILAIGALALLEMKFEAVSGVVQTLINLFRELQDVWRTSPWEAITGGRFSGGLLSGWLRDQGLPGWLVGMQHGGRMINSGTVLVGERGPEVLHLPARAAVEPLSVGRAGWGEGGPITIYPAPVLIDGREVAEVVFEHRLDRLARK